MARLKELYKKEVVPRLMNEFKYKNKMQVPALEKIVLNMGLGDAVANIKVLDSAVQEMSSIAGQKPVLTRARKSISAFKLRSGMQIGCMVTLRKEKMYEFFDRLVNIALPRIKDFKGLSKKSFDGKGNYTLGIEEQIIFLEINYDKVEKIRGLNISIVTTAKKDAEAMVLLKALGLPFKD